MKPSEHSDVDDDTESYIDDLVDFDKRCHPALEAQNCYQTAPSETRSETSSYIDDLDAFSQRAGVPPFAVRPTTSLTKSDNSLYKDAPGSSDIKTLAINNKETVQRNNPRQSLVEKKERNNIRGNGNVEVYVPQPPKLLQRKQPLPTIARQSKPESATKQKATEAMDFVRKTAKRSENDTSLLPVFWPIVPALPRASKTTSAPALPKKSQRMSNTQQRSPKPSFETPQAESPVYHSQHSSRDRNNPKTPPLAQKISPRKQKAETQDGKRRPKAPPFEARPEISPKALMHVDVGLNPPAMIVPPYPPSKHSSGPTKARSPSITYLPRFSAINGPSASPNVVTLHGVVPVRNECPSDTDTTAACAPEPPSSCSKRSESSASLSSEAVSTQESPQPVVGSALSSPSPRLTASKPPTETMTSHSPSATTDVIDRHQEERSTTQQPPPVQNGTSAHSSQLSSRGKAAKLSSVEEESLDRSLIDHVSRTNYRPPTVHTLSSSELTHAVKRDNSKADGPHPPPADPPTNGKWAERDDLDEAINEWRRVSSHTTTPATAKKLLKKLAGTSESSIQSKNSIEPNGVVANATENPMPRSRTSSNHKIASSNASLRSLQQGDPTPLNAQPSAGASDPTSSSSNTWHAMQSDYSPLLTGPPRTRRSRPSPHNETPSEASRRLDEAEANRRPSERAANRTARIVTDEPGNLNVNGVQRRVVRYRMRSTDASA